MTASRRERPEALAEHIKRVVDGLPPLTGDQLARLRALLPPPERRPTDPTA